jgi:molybdenum cofactor biosynthesis protein B
MAQEDKVFCPLGIAVLTVSDRLSAADDTSGDYLQQAAQQAGHHIVARQLVAHNRYVLRALVSAWIADKTIDAVLISGGTGFSAKDVTPEAITPLFDKTIDGFGELFRMLSFEDIGTATLQSRALAGLANQTAIFALPGSTGACRTAWERIIAGQLDAREKPCNFVTHLKK